MCLSGVFFSHAQSSMWPSNKHSLSWLQLQEGEARRRALKLAVEIVRIGETSLLWSQSHNPKQSTISLRRCLQHFFIICFYSWKCCSLFLWLWLSVALSLPLSYSLDGISQPLLYEWFPLAKTPCFRLRALCCNSSKCPVYEYFISKHISCTVSFFTMIKKKILLEAQNGRLQLLFRLKIIVLKLTEKLVSSKH